MSKAYNRVEWSYIEEIMNQMGFSDRWKQRIMNCIRLVSYSILINGSPSKEFKPSRGLRQGDPFSPYLFLLCAEGFSNLLNREESLSNLSGFRINNLCPPLTHLFFAMTVSSSLKLPLMKLALSRKCWNGMRRPRGRPLTRKNLPL